MTLYFRGLALARCGAYLEILSDWSAKNGKPAAAEHLADLARGWKIAAQVHLQIGGAKDAAKVGTAAAATERTRLRAIFETNDPGALKSMADKHTADCDPLQETEEATVEMMREKAATGAN